MADTKTCTKCNESKDLDSFSRVNKFSDKRRARCKQCGVAHTKIWRQANPRKAVTHSLEWQAKNKEKVKNYHQKKRLLEKFNLTIEEYTAKLITQNYVCALCKNKCQSGRNLAVDHCHKTNKIRGLLCGNCNMGLGSFRDNIDLLQTAIKYLDLYEKS